MNIRKLLIAALLLPAAIQVRADEGMWIPSLIGKNYEQMKKMGLKLTADDIYNINKSSMKDAIVSMGFCSAEIISPEGLMLTNHHCGYGTIQFNSSVEHDYLKNGFWAHSHAEELPAPGVTASILQRIEEVTDKVRPQLVGLDATARAAKLKEIEAKLTEEYTKGTTGYTAALKEMFYGNQYFIYVYEKFTDLRLVGAPPESVGKFGGDTDNWMWPRHTGDFSMFRIYANKDNKPAPYSKDNVPYKPKHFLPISLKGIQENDFTMIMGNPGRTNRYASSYELQNAVDVVNPLLIELLGKKLETWKSDMDKSTEVRIKLAAKYASTANSWKYYIGQTKGLKRLKVVDQKRATEATFMTWVNADATRKAKYSRMFNSVDSAYKAYHSNYPVSLNYQLGAMGSEMAGMAGQLAALNTLLQKAPVDTAAVRKRVAGMKEGIDKFYKDYNAATDQKVFANLLKVVYKNLPEAQLPGLLKEAVAKHKELPAEQAIDKYAEEVFANTMVINKEKVTAFLNNPKAEDLEKDAGYNYYSKTSADLKKLVDETASVNFSNLLAREKELYIAGLMEMDNKKNMYPDANSCIRLTYGKIDDYKPADGVNYSFFTTADGILEKEDATSDEFNVPPRLIDLLKKRDYGRYADKDGSLHVAFISTNDITGGNSGSAVINGKGELIGAAFDGNWEAMTGDLVYDAQYKRTISVDIRYVLFIIDKYAGAGNIVSEMKLMQ